MISQRHIDLLLELGTDKVEHTKSSFFEHLKGTADLLESWGNDESLCVAGLFHSIYGTEDFTDQTMGFEKRDLLKAQIGDEAEELVYLFGTTKRRSFFYNLGSLANGGELNVYSNVLEKNIPVSKEILTKLFELEVANLLDQAPPQLPPVARSSMVGMVRSLKGIISQQATDAVDHYLANH